MRINKFLAQCELGSRRKVESFVVDGKISVNGIVITDLAYDIKDTDIVSYNGKTLREQSKKVYIMLNKPKCYITSLKDEQGRKVVVDLLKGCGCKVFPVGRLDYNTEGLLLLTNDGEWANSITHPSKHMGKTYEIKLKYKPTEKQLKQIRNGIVIDGVKTLPAEASIVGIEDDFVIVNVTIYEGRNREIRKIFESLNLKIYNLKRIAIGNLKLGDLKMGKYRYLSENDRKMIFMR